MHKPGVREKEMIKVFWNFEIQANHPIPVRRPDLNLIDKKKRTFHPVYFTVSTIKEGENWKKISRAYKRAEKVVEHEGGGDIHRSWRSLNSPPESEKEIK